MYFPSGARRKEMEGDKGFEGGRGARECPSLKGSQACLLGSMAYLCWVVVRADMMISSLCVDSGWYSQGVTFWESY